MTLGVSPHLSGLVLCFPRVTHQSRHHHPYAYVRGSLFFCWSALAHPSRASSGFASSGQSLLFIPGPQWSVCHSYGALGRFSRNVPVQRSRSPTSVWQLLKGKGSFLVSVSVSLSLFLRYIIKALSKFFWMNNWKYQDITKCCLQICEGNRHVVRLQKKSKVQNCVFREADFTSACITFQ